VEKPAFWNHNAAYYPWVRRQLDRSGAKRVLDVGCGEGSLARYLAAPGREILGIDPSEEAIALARSKTGEGAGVRFLPVTLEGLDAPPGSLDGVVFVASLHHTDGEGALRKARELLKPGGLLLIVGLASPSGPGDWALEALRVLPAKLGSALHRERSSEALGLIVNYALPPMGEVRALVRRELPGAKLRSGLYYRWLLRWTKP
jgi:2-polyprenyl-3-methyl-5-hydroxy-6-metoxy-1,4-benzoquinol methylase